MNSKYAIQKDDIVEYIEKHCLFLPEKYFMTKEEMLSDSFQYIIDDLIKSIFKSDTDYTMIAINVSYLKEEGQIRAGMTTYIKNHYTHLIPITSEGNNFYYICKKDIEPFIKEKSHELYQAIDQMFMKIAFQSIHFYNNSTSLSNNQSIDYSHLSKDPMLLLPIISSCSYDKLTNSSVNIVIDEITKDIILSKNEDRMPNIKKHYVKAKVTYRLYWYDYKNNIFITIDKYKINKEKVIFKLNQLEANHCYSFKISVIFNEEYFSSPKANFYFYTKANLNKNNDLFVYGNNENGELIDMTSSSYTQLTKITADIIDYSYQDSQSVIVLSNGEIVNGGKCWLDKNSDDHLFDIESNSNPNIRLTTSTPFTIPIPNGVYIRKVALGNEHCIALSNHGQVFSWGANAFGQLGQGIEKSLIVGKPKPITFPSNVFITDITSGINHSIVLGLFNNKTEIYYWGYGMGNELSLINSYTQSKVYCTSSPLKVNFPEGPNILKIYAKYNMSSFIVKSTSGVNHVYTFGINTNYQLGFDNDLLELNKNWEVPTFVSTLAYSNLSVINISFCETYSLFIVKRKNNNNCQKIQKEIFIAGMCDIIKDTPMKIPEKLMIEKENIVTAYATKHTLYILFEDGQLVGLAKKTNYNKTLSINKSNLSVNSPIKIEGTSNNVLLMKNSM